MSLSLRDSTLRLALTCGITSSCPSFKEGLSMVIIHIHKTQFKTKPSGRDPLALVISHDDIKKALDTLDSDFYIGPDELHPYLIKSCSNSLSYHIRLISKKSSDTSMVPYIGNTSGSYL
ncbi:hypothetical protein E2C01_003084 [Portunus trituberculatus]|uniref:Uncharacterized protein n=1 Tax=Portunus trituberculatus TaxID=210409 RepID=A0A5B7CN20_PORTR|nr:hypothetical protein [Portunus trituberculatus]